MSFLNISNLHNEFKQKFLKNRYIYRAIKKKLKKLD